MSEVKRFRADHRHVVETEFDDAQFVSVADYDATLAREAALRESLNDKREEYNKLGDRYDALQQRLAVAEQRAADLKKLICDVINDEPTGFAALKVDLANRVNDALKPAAEGEGS